MEIMMSYNDAQRDRERALVLAQDHMRKLGKFNPIQAPGQSKDDWYAARLVYGALESTAYALILQNMTAKPKNSEEKLPNQKWGRPYRDD